jgi:hypothetical protein
MKENGMQQRVRGSAILVVIILLAGIALAAANVAILLATVKGTLAIAQLAEVYQLYPLYLLSLVAAPILVAILLAVAVQQLMVGRGAATHAEATPESKPAVPALAAPAPPSPAPALRLLAVLQEEGRLIDFIEEDIDGYSDAQVGAAVRSIHAGCRKALRQRIQLERIFAAADGSEVVVEAGFDAAAVRLTGNVAGAPPFRGILQHAGWRAATVALPQSPGDVDPHIIAPAEVEIP